MQEAHKSNISAHSSETKTYNKIREYFYWRNLEDDAKEWVYSLVFIPFFLCNILFSFSEFIAKVFIQKWNKNSGKVIYVKISHQR